MDEADLVKDVLATGARILLPISEQAAADLGLTDPADREVLGLAIADAYSKGLSEGQTLAHAQAIESGVDVQPRFVRVEGDDE